MKACLLGAPISHALSPRLHRFWLKKHGIDGAYDAVECAAAELPKTLARLMEDGFAGCNLTLPLKEQALSLMDVLDDSARHVGAVNTVVFKDGKKIGYNSDGFGFIESLKAQRPGWKGDHQTAVILGAGGAARSVIAALKKEGIKHFILLNRTTEKARALARDLALMDPWIAPWEKRSDILEDASLLVNCSSLGMKGQPSMDIDISGLPETALVCDIVYRPLNTELLKAARARKLATLNGLPMLLHQGRLGFKLWFGTDPAVTAELYEDMARCAEE
jgi:shikimate dehydrogenase